MAAGVGGEPMAEFGDIGRSSVVEVMMCGFGREYKQVAKRSVVEGV
jgi:hypothetical protein